MCATFQGLKSHMWLVAAALDRTDYMQNTAITAERSTEQHCSGA